MEQVFETTYILCQQNNEDHFTFEGEKISIKDKRLEQVTNEFNEQRQPAMILLQLETAYKLIALRLKNDSISVTKLEDEQHEYVTSDNPVIASNQNAHHVAPFDPENLLRLPLDSKHTLLLIPECPSGLENKIFRNTTKGTIAEMEKLTANYSQMKNAEKHMFGSKRALTSYLKLKLESERTLADGEKTADVYSKLKKLGL